jgi:circadian clock protein KaiC
MRQKRMSDEPLKLVTTGVPNLDQILGGGLPLYSVNIIAGASGTGKTILTQQILFHNCRDDVRGIFFTTLSEPAFKMIRYQQQFSYFDLDRLNENIFFVDIGQVLRDGGLDEALRIINQHVEEQGASFIAIDSFKAIHDLAGSRAEVRRFGYDLAVSLAAWTCTSFLVGEYNHKEILSEPIFAVADGIFYMTNLKQGMQNVRRLNMIKMRGMDYFTGDHPVTISPAGISIYPRLKTPPVPKPTPTIKETISTGIHGLDLMVDGGIARGSATLVAGSAGTGKTLISLHFIVEGAKQGESGLYIAFQETPDHLKSIAAGFGWDLERFINQGLLRILYTSPVEMGVDEHAHAIRKAIEELGARRVVIDSLMDIEIATPDKVRYKDYVYSLVNDFRSWGVTSLLTSEIPEIFGSLQLTAHGISFISDNVILLRYVEIGSSLRRGINVMKMRGQNHDKSVREFEITTEGLHVLDSFGEWASVLSGQPHPFEQSAANQARTWVSVENRVVEALARRGKATASELARHLTLRQLEVQKVLDTLLEHKFVDVENQESTKLYRWKT